MSSTSRPTEAAQASHSTTSGYLTPPDEITEVVLATPTPQMSISPDGDTLMFFQHGGLPPLEDVMRPMLRLAGMRIDPEANARFTPMFWTSMWLRPLQGGEDVAVPLPEGARIISASWAPDGSRFGVMFVTEEGTELWVGPTDQPDQARLVTTGLHLIMGGISWTPCGSKVLCHVVPADRGKAPSSPRTPDGPNVQETSEKSTPLPTYQDLLKSEEDAELWEYYAQSDLVLITLDSGERQPIGRGIHTLASLSPDGQWIMTGRAVRPYSFTMPYTGFPHRVEVAPIGQPDKPAFAWDLPSEEGIPLHGVEDWPRSMRWASNEPATLYWIEALDGGDPKVKVEHRDRWMRAKAPFPATPEGTPQEEEVLRLEHRAYGLSFFEAPGRALASEYDRDRRWIRSRIFDLDGDGEPRVLDDRSMADRYAALGSPMTRLGPFGRSVIREDGLCIYRNGAGASEGGDRPRLVKQNLETLEVEELWRCDEEAYEYVVDLLECGGIITRHESETLPPNYFICRAGGQRLPLTEFPDPQPSLRGITKERLTYERADGVGLSGTLYLPADYKPGTKLPLVIWGYPTEYVDGQVAGQIQGTTKQFTRLGGSSHILLVTQGYAVLDDAAMPIVGDPETMNDTFVEQLVASAKAAVDACVERGVADRERVGVAGHSYGAFMTASLLAHSDLFRAGIARSGAYNRTLTPFGFQRERRTLWESPEAYLALSPIMHADKIEAPLLLIHGEEDNNTGTYPLQSRRLYQALEGHGRKARLVMLPGESHGYVGKESVLHVHHEMLTWFDRHVKNASNGQ